MLWTSYKNFWVLQEFKLVTHDCVYVVAIYPIGKKKTISDFCVISLDKQL